MKRAASQTDRERNARSSPDPRSAGAAAPGPASRGKLLFVGTNRGGGGIESYFVTMVRALADRGFEVTAVVSPGAMIHRALVGDARVNLIPVTFQRRNDIAATVAVFRIARALRPDWIIGMYLLEFWPLAIVARALSIPLVLFEHVERRMHPVMTHLLPRFLTRMIAPSRFLREHLIRSGVPAAKTAVLHNPIDVQYFHPDAIEREASRARLGFAPNDVVVGFVGRMEAEKGLDVLADAVAAAMDERTSVRALWVGDGAAAAALRARLNGSPHADRHRWTSWVDDARAMYAAMDVLALPSTGKESFGRVLVEAQACGIPVLGSDTGGIPEALHDGVSGLLCPPGDVMALTRAIVLLVDDEALRARMAACGVALARRHFDVRTIADRFARALDSGMQVLDAEFDRDEADAVHAGAAFQAPEPPTTLPA